MLAPGTTETAQGAVPTAYTRIKQETVYSIQSLRGDVVSLISSESAGGGGSASGDELPPSPGNPSVAGARVLETVRYTSFGVPRVYRRYACDIADDEGNPLVRGVTVSPLVPNNGVTEADLNVFMAGFFDMASEFHWACDIADDSGFPLQDGGPVGASPNYGVTEGDYNLFFAQFFNGGSDVEFNDEWGQLSFPEHNNRIGYAGYWWDERVNMYVVRNRWYTPRTGRWLTPDPIGYAGGRNLYEYCNSQPFDYTDPMGLEPWAWYQGYGTTLSYLFGGGPDGAAGQVWADAGRGAAKNPVGLAQGIYQLAKEPVVIVGNTIGAIDDQTAVDNSLLMHLTYSATIAGNGDTSSGVRILAVNAGDEIKQTFIRAAHGDLEAIGDISWNTGLFILPLPGVGTTGTARLTMRVALANEAKFARFIPAPLGKWALRNTSTGFRTAATATAAGKASPPKPDCEAGCGANPARTKSLLPGEGAVGTFRDLDDLGATGDNLTPHHVPSANLMARHGVARGDGVSIMMEQPVPGVGGRHRFTFTYGTSADVEMTLRDSLAAGVRDLRRIYMNDGLYGTFVRHQLQEIGRQNKALFPGLFKK